MIIIAAGSPAEGLTFYGSWANSEAEEAVQWATDSLIAEWSIMQLHSAAVGYESPNGRFIAIAGDIETGLYAEGPYSSVDDIYNGRQFAGLVSTATLYDKEEENA
jgi:hypothetical protein